MVGAHKAGDLTGHHHHTRDTGQSALRIMKKSRLHAEEEKALQAQTAGKEEEWDLYMSPDHAVISTASLKSTTPVWFATTQNKHSQHKVNIASFLNKLVLFRPAPPNVGREFTHGQPSRKDSNTIPKNSA